MRRRLLSIGSLLVVLVVVLLGVIAAAPATAADSPRGPTINQEIAALWNNVLGWMDVRPDATPAGIPYIYNASTNNGNGAPPGLTSDPPGMIEPQGGPGLDPDG